MCLASDTVPCYAVQLLCWWSGSGFRAARLSHRRGGQPATLTATYSITHCIETPPCPTNVTAPSTAAVCLSPHLAPHPVCVHNKCYRPTSCLLLGALLLQTLEAPVALIGNPFDTSSICLDVSQTSVNLTAGKGSMLGFRFLGLSGILPHPSSVVCSRLLRSAGLVSGSAPWPLGCPPSEDGKGMSALAALGVQGGSEAGAEAVTDRSNLSQLEQVLGGWASLMWAFRPKM